MIKVRATLLAASIAAVTSQAFALEQSPHDADPAAIQDDVELPEDSARLSLWERIFGAKSSSTSVDAKTEMGVAHPQAPVIKELAMTDVASPTVISPGQSNGLPAEVAPKAESKSIFASIFGSAPDLDQPAISPAVVEPKQPLTHRLPNLGGWSATTDPYDNEEVLTLKAKKKEEQIKKHLPKPLAEVVPSDDPAVVSSYRLIGGIPIHDQMSTWARSAGWVLDWKLNTSWLAPADSEYRGTVDQAIEAVVNQLYAEGKPVKLVIWSNKYAEIVDVSSR